MSSRSAGSGSADVLGPRGDLTQRAFLANLRHELRTPLNAVIGYSEMLLEDTAEAGDAAQELRADLQRILTAGQQLLARVNDVLDQSRLEAGQLDVDSEEFGANLRHELRIPITTIIGYTEMLLEDAPAAGHGTLVSDLQKIHSAGERFLALIDEVVSFRKIETGEVPPEAAAHDTTAMIAGVVTTIRELEREEGAGGAGELAGILLVVDDDPINRDVLARRLERQGHTVWAVESGRRALGVLNKCTFDLVLLDVMMPEMNGYQVLQQLKADEHTREIPVIMISALDEIDSVVRCIEMGAEDYLPKPFNPVLLRARIGACLEKKRLRDKEIEYLRQVAKVTTAAAAVEGETFQPDSLDPVAARQDELGQLARVFQRMAREVYERERRLKQQVQELRIQIDDAKKAREVAEITDSEYFQELQRKAKRLRRTQEQ